MLPPRTAEELRAAFIEFFVQRGHATVPSASLIPHDDTLLFTNAGMVPFKPYFVGDEAAPWPRAVSVQKCVRAGGKHNDLEAVGRTNRHLTFFEMLGNFSFGDYFKTEAIPWAWELVTQGFGLDPERLWVTVHETDDEAERIWRDVVGVVPERIQRLGDDNFWRMADTGPCGPSSEIFWDLGEAFGSGGGPALNEDRFVEIWNLVFMQFDQQADGTLVPLPKPCVDTGAGVERTLAVLQGVPTIYEVDVFRPLLAAAERVTGVGYGGFPGGDSDVSLRILAEHGRSMTFLVADGVVPSNEDRGYVLRRLIRRAVRHAFLLGAKDVVTPTLVDATVAVMGGAYPELLKARDLVVRTVQREEERFRQTLERGLDLLDEVMARGDVSGADAFFLHDTLGFPIDLTREIAQERSRSVDLEDFRLRMGEQRSRAQEAQKAAATRGGGPEAVLRELVETVGPTEFTGRQENVTEGAVIRALVIDAHRVPSVKAESAPASSVGVVLDRTPFYAESGGQVGDTGTLCTASGATLRVTGTHYGLPGLVVHEAELTAGSIAEGDVVSAAIDVERRDRIRRNHTATHVLHWALREVLGAHVQQAGSMVAPDRLRFDFAHFEAVTADELDRVEALANAEVISDAPVRHFETTKEHAQALGAIAFFGDKYGDLVRVLEAGEHSLELCGGTHVHALGFIGPIKIVSEGSVGANLRRIEAVTGDLALARIHDGEVAMRQTASLLSVAPAEVVERVERLLAEAKGLRDELAVRRRRDIQSEAKELAERALDGTVIERRDGATPDELRQLVVAARDLLGSGIVGVVGVAPDGAKAALAVGVTKDLIERGATAGAVAADAAKLLGGGTGKQADVAVGGGPNAGAVDAALEQVRRRAAEAVSALR